MVPSPLGDPHLLYFLGRVNPHPPSLAGDWDIQAESIVQWVGGGGDCPFLELTLVLERPWWDCLPAQPVGGDLAGDSLECQIVEIFRESDQQACHVPVASQATHVLIEEHYEPHVETLDVTSWRVVDLSPGEYTKLWDTFVQEMQGKEKGDKELPQTNRP